MNFSVYVRKDRYIEILGFTIYSYIVGAITAYSGMQGGRKRSLGEYIESFIYGKVAEEAFKGFLRNNGLKVYTELDINGFLKGVYIPDLILIEKNGSLIPLKFWIDVKEIRREQKWFLLGSRSALLNRPFDAYVAVWVGLKDEHIAWTFNYIKDIKDRMSDDVEKFIEEIDKNVSNIPCEIKGFVTWHDVSKILNVIEGIENGRNVDSIVEELNSKFKRNGWYYFTSSDKLKRYFRMGEKLFDPDTEEEAGKVGENVGFYIGYLEEATRDRWREFFELISENKPLVPRVDLFVKARRKGKPVTRSKPVSKICKKLVPNYKGIGDYRKIHQSCIERQLDIIKRKNNEILRLNRSWFSERFQ